MIGLISYPLDDVNFDADCDKGAAFVVPLLPHDQDFHEPVTSLARFVRDIVGLAFPYAEFAKYIVSTAPSCFPPETSGGSAPDQPRAVLGLGAALRPGDLHRCPR